MATPIRSASAAALAALAFLLLPLSATASAEDDEIPSSVLGNTAPSGFSQIDPVFGAIVSDRELAAQRGGADLHLNENNATAVVQDNVARNLTTGNNTISDNAFSNTNGVPMVVQTSGNNVVIQNSTILNLQLQ
ncbi:MAG: hypothetical protein ACLGHY_10285 [Gammaproteobacteria bacterium]